jgi:hypothetical protein
MLPNRNEVPFPRSRAVRKIVSARRRNQALETSALPRIITARLSLCDEVIAILTATIQTLRRGA